MRLCLWCSCTLLTHFIDVLFSLSFSSGRPYNSLDRTVQVVPSSCLSASWGVGISSVNLKHMYTQPWPGEQLLWLPATVCSTVVGRMENDPRTVASIERRSAGSWGTVGVSHELWASSASPQEAMAGGATWLGPTSAGALSSPLKHSSFSPASGFQPVVLDPSPRGSCTLICTE